MTKSIYDILSTYEYSVDTEEAFIKSIEKVRKQINTINAENNTPIMHYCYVHLNSGISPFVIRTLITRFHADISTKVNERIPLSILLNQDNMNLSNNIAVIELLYEYTKTRSILTVGSPKVITDILFKLPLSSPATDYTSLQRRVNILSHEMDFNIFSNIIFTVNEELYSNALSVDTPERLKLVLDFIQWAQGNAIIVEPLLLEAIRMNKISLVNKILELYPINLDNQFNNVMINPSRINVLAHDALLNDPNIISITKIISNQIENDIYDYKSTNIIVICSKVIDLNNVCNLTPREEDETYRELIKSANGIIHQSIDVNSGTINYQEISKFFGFNNNIFHYLALTDLPAERFTGDDAHEALLFQQNAFGQTPLKIAILYNNRHFIEYIKPILSKKENLLYNVDYHKNTLGHILAIKPLSQSNLQWILDTIAPLLDTTLILEKTNKLGQSPIHLAVLTNNIEFIKWWEDQGGSFAVIDNTKKTLWHYFIKSQVINNVKDLDRQYIHNKLNEKIAHMVSYADADGTIPINLALTSPLALELLLKDYGDNINYQHRDKAGNTISHILSTNFVDRHHRTYDYVSNIHNKIVTLLIPYADKIQANYNMLNNNNQYPINIIETKLNYRLSFWLHNKVSHDLLKKVSESLELPFKTTNSAADTFGSSDVPIRGLRIRVDDNINALLDNKFIFFSESIVLKTYEIKTLYPSTIDIIRALSFEIAYSNANELDNSSVIQFLITIDPLGLDIQLTVFHLLKILDNRIVNNICHNSNQLGEYLVHTVVEYNRDIILQHLLSLDPQLLSQATQPRTYNTESLRLYPCDYAILLQTNGIRAVIKEFKSKNPDYKLISNVQSIITELNMNEQAIDNYFLGEIGKPDDLKLQIGLLSLCNNFDIKLQENMARNEDHHYFPMLSHHIKYLQNKYLALIYKDGYQEIYGLNHLQKYLVGYKNHDKKHCPRFISFLDKGHASSLVLFKDHANQFRALLHDSITHPIHYIGRVSVIKQALRTHLQIDEQNVHEVDVPQQGAGQENCLLWTIVNLRLIESALSKKETNCVSCIPLPNRRNEISWVDHDNKLQQIKHILGTSAKPLVNLLENEISKCHKYSCSIQESFIPFQKLFGILVSNHDDTLDSNAKQAAHASKLPLLKEDIESILHIYYEKIFKIYTIDQDYYNSNHGLVILEGSKDDSRILRAQINGFVDNIFHPTDVRDLKSLLSRTFIINKDKSHWVTLVIVANTKSAKIYFADSRADSMPKYTETIIKSYLSSHYKTLEIHEKIVDTTQINDLYNSGLWAIKNADYIINACEHKQDISVLQSIIKDNIEQDRNQIMQQREIVNMKYVRSVPQILEFQAFEEQINAIGLTPYQTSSCTHSSIMPSNRQKRTICNEEQNTEPMIDILRKFAIPENDRIDMQLYFNIACLAALQDSTNDKKSKIHNTLRYISGIYDILSEGPENRSAREQAIIDKYYQNVNEPVLLSTIKNQLFSRPQYLQHQDDSIIFYNDHCSIIVSHENGYYLLYSQNYRYNTAFKTKEGVTLADIQKFVELFFSFYSVDTPGYNMFFLDENQYKKDVLLKLEKADIWNNDDTMQSDLELLLESKDPKIEDVPISIIRTIFLVDNQVLDLRLLHDDFFSTNLKRIALRIDQIHKAFFTSDIEQLEALKRLIKKYNFPCDTTYFDKINPNTNQYTRLLISQYHIKMQKKLKDIEKLTLGYIEESTYEILDYVMQMLDIPSELRASSLENMRTVYSSFAHYTKLHRHKITQTSFVIPDLIKAFNYNQYIPPLQSLGLLSADMQASKYMVQLYKRIIGKMGPHLDPDILKAINSLPGLEDVLHEGIETAIQNPIFKILTIHALIHLLNKVNTIDPNTAEYEIINHKLNEEWTTIGFMILESCNIEMAPGWFTLMIERLRYDGHQIALLHNLNIPAWQETLIGLGFYQDEVDYMIEESDLINYNLQLVDATIKHFVHDQNHTSAGLYIIKIPHLLKKRIWYPINAEQVPWDIQNILMDKGNQALINAQNPLWAPIPPTWSRPNMSISIQNNYRIEYYDRKNYKYSIYKYNASGSNTTIIFREYTEQEYKQSGSKDDVFADVIILPNSTWLRLPQKVSCWILGFWCHETPQSFVIRDTGYSALYYSNNNIDQTLLVQKNISYVFDPREGNMSITFTQDVMKKLNHNTNTESYFTVFVQQKSYPAILSFQDECPHASLKLHDANNLIRIKYFILNNYSPFVLHDNANVRYIIAATVQIPYSQTTYHKTIISGTSKNILLDSTDNIKSHHSTIVSSKNKDKISIYLDPSTYHIGDNLYLSDKDISIDNVLGQSNQSTIVFTGQNDQQFRLTLLGDIVVSDLPHSRLRVLGHYQSKGSVYSKWYDTEMSYTEYKIYVQDFSSVFNTMFQLLHANGTWYIEFTDTNNVQYQWYRQQSAGHLSVIDPDVPGVTLQISSEFNVLELYNKSKLQYKFATVRYDATMQYNGYGTIQKIFINSNKSFEPTNIIQNIQNSSNFNDYSFLSSMNGSIILFFSNGHDWYNIWPLSRDITINNINYQITEDGICHMPSDRINNNGYNHVFEYVDFNSYSSKHSRVPSCNRETSEVKARAERSISNADYAYSHLVGISYSDGQDVNNDTTILNNYSDNTLSQTTNGCSSLSPFGSTIVNLIRTTLSKIFMTIKYYYAPIPNQASRQISSVEEDIKIDNTISDTEELNNAIKQQKVVEEISSDANSNGAAKMLNDHTNFVVNKNNGTSNIIDNLKLDDNSYNGSTQGTNTFDINGNLMLGQILTYKLFGKNPLCQNTRYLSPTQERNIILNQVSSEVLSMCNDFINDTNTFNYNAPSWYQDLWQDNL